MSFWCCCGGGGHVLTPCPCTVPATVYYHDPTSNYSWGTFDGGLPGVTSIPIVWGPKPADLSAYGGRPDPGFYSPSTYTTGSGFYVIRYGLDCGSAAPGRYGVVWYAVPSSPVYPATGVPQSWLAGLPGNTCSPFLMSLDQSSNANPYLSNT